MTASDCVRAHSEAVTAPLALTGYHNVYVRGLDCGRQLGCPSPPFRPTTDTVGPISTPSASRRRSPTARPTSRSTAPSPTTPLGGSVILGADFRINGGPATPWATSSSPTASTPSRSASSQVIPASMLDLAARRHLHHRRPSLRLERATPVRSRDFQFVLDRQGPDTTFVSVAPNPTNGVIGIDSTNKVMRVKATMPDATSAVVRAEGFLERCPAGARQSRDRNSVRADRRGVELDVRGHPARHSDGAGGDPSRRNQPPLGARQGRRRQLGTVHRHFLRRSTRWLRRSRRRSGHRVPTAPC